MNTGRMGDLIGRYRSGEFEAVWREIRSQGSVDGEFRQEVMEVAEETMRRVARNADLLTERLQAEGWQALSGELRTPPSSDDSDVFERIEQITEGPLPPSLYAFWTVVGGVDCVWNYNSSGPMPGLGVDLAMEEMDPICVDPPRQVTYLFDQWLDQKTRPDPGLVDPFSLDLAPDHYHKADVSGGEPYGIELPFHGADPIFANERHGLPFVDYLRLCFKWAGFPGLNEYRDWDDARNFVERFGKDLEPF